MAADMFTTLEQATQLVDEGNPDEAYRVMKSAVIEDSHGFARIFLSEWMKHVEGEEGAQSKFEEVLLFLKEDFPELPLSVEDKPPTAVMPTFSSSQAMPVWLAPLDRPSPPPVTMKRKPVAEPVPEPKVAEYEPEVLVPEPVEPVLSVADAVEEEKQVEPVEEHVHTVEPVPVSPEASLEPEEIEHLTLTFYEWQMAAILKAAVKEKMNENSLLAQILETRKLEPLMWSRYKHGKTSSPTHRITISVPHTTKVSIEKDKDSEGIKTTTKFVRKMLFGQRAEKA